ncbi:MAG TPA: prolyl oligopeptidase family serine peptidase [Vicinamibacterales bacterium]|nr:prolyl oligopeptidase family serine peptidase [Vicinamibacterales bacterium]
MRHFACAAALLLLAAFAGAQEKPAPSPPNTKIEGMPPIPQSILDGVARYGQFRTAQLMAWHPTKRQVIINTSFNSNPSSPQLHLVDGPGRDRRQLTWMTRGVSPNVAVAFAPANADSFVFQYDASTELRSLYRYVMSTAVVSLVTDAKSRYAPVWSRDGKWLAYDSAERNGTDRDLYVIQPSDPSTKRRLADFAGPFSPQDWTPDGAALIANEVLSNSETYLWKVDVKTGQKTAITPRDGEKAAFFNARLSQDGRKLYAMSDRAGGEFRIWRCDVANCTWTAVTPEGMTVDGPNDFGSGFEISPDGSMLAVTADRGSSSELQVIDLTTLKPRALPAMPRGIVTRVQWRPGSREVGFTLESVKAPADVYSIDASLGTLTRWTTSEVSFNSDVLPAPEVVEWKSFDSQTISGILYRPSGKFTGPRPVLINIHGGPDGRERMRWLGRSNYILEELGAAIIYPNVRGSTGFGRKFVQLDDGKLRGDAVKDIGALLDWIATRPELDKNRVALLGVSSGGWLALESGVAYNDRIRGLIEGAGITNFVTFLEGTSPARQANRRAEYGDERDPAMREFLLSLSPALHAAQLKKPTFIIQPGKDARVPVSQAQELLAALKSSSQNVWYLEFTEANHDNLGAVGGDYLLASWMWFFKNFLLN